MNICNMSRALLSQRKVLQALLSFTVVVSSALKYTSAIFDKPSAPEIKIICMRQT